MKRVQLEPWTTWEKLCLANAVQRTGDQNWTAVGRAVKNIYDDTMVYLGNETRPSHWFSMKQCAAQYETLLNSVLGSRRKKRTDKSADPHDPPSHLIYNILKNEFLEELDRKIEDDRSLFKKMKKKQEDVLSGHYDDQLEQLIAEDAREKEREIKLKLKFKLGEKNAERNASSPIKSYPPSTPPDGEMPRTSPAGSNSSTSPLLTSLLQSPSQHSLPSTPSISLLLNSTPSTPTNESPTLSKLLESPSSKVPLNASTSLSSSALPGLSTSAGATQLDVTMRSIARPIVPSESHRMSTSPQKLPLVLLPPPAASEPSSEMKAKEKANEVPAVKPAHSQFGIDSEIVIEEDLQTEKKPNKKSDNEVEEEEEVMESVEDILEKLKEAIIETVGRDSEPDIEVISEQVNKGDEGIEHVHGIVLPASDTSDAKQETSQEEEVESDDRGTVESTDAALHHEETGTSSDERLDDASTPGQTASTLEDKVFTDDEKIDADILAEAKSVVDRRMSDSEPQELVDLVQVAATAVQEQPREPTTAIVERERERDSEDQMELGTLDQEAVEIIVMGSNTNSVINVLSHDSSSEDVTQAVTDVQGKELPIKETVTDQDTEATSSTREDEEDEGKHTTPPQTPSAGEEESESSIGTTLLDRAREYKEDEEDKEDLSSKEEEALPEVEDSSSKDEHVSDHVSFRDDSSSAPETIADQETTSDSVPNQPSPPSSISISAREHLPEVKITLEPLEITLSQSSFKDEVKKTAVADKMRRQSTRKRSSVHLDSKPTSPLSTSFMDDEKEYRAWKKSVMLVYSRIASHKYASVFSKPIADTAGYKALIKCPMDLSTIKRNIEMGVVRSTLDFQRDVMLMIQNAVVYNTHDSPVYSMALEMWYDVIGQMNVMVQAVGDGVVLGGTTVQGDTPGRHTRRQQNVESKKSLPTHATPKRRKV